MFKLLFWICKDINNILNINELQLKYRRLKLCLTYCISDYYLRASEQTYQLQM